MKNLITARQALTGASVPVDIGLGSVRLTAARLTFERGRFVVALDGTVTAGPLTVELLGLGLEFSLGEALTVEPRLQGVSAAFVRSMPTRIEVQAALLRLLPPREGFAGGISIEVERILSLQALVMWERKNGWDSIFAYAEVRRDTGLFAVGPVIFTGVALGFGVNSSLRRPAIDEVATFPLLGRVGDGVSGENSLSDALESLSQTVDGKGPWVTPSAGAYWIAGGVTFSVFKFIETKAVIVVDAGNGGWGASLVGRTTLDLPRPRNGTTMARVIVDFAIDYDSRLERFALDVQIAPGSYVLDPRAQIHGGMALYVWGKDTPAQKQGFVLTVGGYHPLFQRPGHFPNPPRVGFDFQLGPVAITGGVYAALTGNTFMIGGASRGTL